MPTFYQEAEFDVSISEFLDELNNRELNELIDYLVDDDLVVRIEDVITPNDPIPDSQKSISDLEWHKTITALSGNTRLRLTQSEEAIIKEIAKRFM